MARRTPRYTGREAITNMVDALSAAGPILVGLGSLPVAAAMARFLLKLLLTAVVSR